MCVKLKTVVALWDNYINCQDVQKRVYSLLLSEWIWASNRLWNAYIALWFFFREATFMSLLKLKWKHSTEYRNTSYLEIMKYKKYPKLTSNGFYNLVHGSFVMWLRILCYLMQNVIFALKAQPDLIFQHSHPAHFSCLEANIIDLCKTIS